MAAFVIDGLILSIVGLVLGAFFFDRFARMGQSGHWVGFLVAATYGGVLNSVAGGGQTVGKRFLRIQVVDSAGGLISLPRSLMREAVLFGPFFASGVTLPASLMFHPVSRAFVFLYTFILGVLSVSLFYLYVFNRQSRQSAHDLLFGTFVTQVDSVGPVIAQPLLRKHRWIIASMATVIALFVWFGAWLGRTELFAGMLTVIERIEADDRVSTATVNIGTTWSSINGVSQKKTVFATTVAMKVRPDSYEKTAKEIAGIVLATYPKAAPSDSLSVTITYGYDIGIARSQTAMTFSHPPGQWFGL